MRSAAWLVLALGTAACSSPVEPPLAGPGDVSVSLALSGAELEAGSVLDVIVAVRSHATEPIVWALGSPPFTIEFRTGSHEAGLLHPPNRFAIRVVQVLAPGELVELRHRFDGQVWAGSDAHRLPPGSYELVARAQDLAGVASAPAFLEVR